MDLAALKAEIGRAVYDGLSDAEVAEALNTIASDHQIDRALIPSREIIGATDPGDWSGLSPIERQRYQTITGAGEVDPSQANVRSAFSAMFPDGSATRDALLALLTRDGTRAEVVLGAGVSVTPSDVANARRS